VVSRGNVVDVRRATGSLRGRLHRALAIAATTTIVVTAPAAAVAWGQVDQASAGHPRSHATSHTPSTPTKTYVVTFSDEGRRYHLHLKDVLEVRLSTPSGVSWSELSSSSQNVLKRISGSSGKSATATFEAVRDGSAEVGSIGSPLCTGACPMFLIDFQISVVVG
jgi:hypothetical protein